MTSVDVPALVPRRLAALGSALYPPGSRIGPRRLANFELVLLVSGSAVLTVDAHTERLLTGSWVLNRPGSVDTYHWDPVHVSRHLYVHFELDSPGDTSRWPVVRHWPSETGLAAAFQRLLWLSTASDLVGQRVAMELTVALLVSTFVHGTTPSDHRRDRADTALTAALAHVRARWDAEGLVAVSRRDMAATAAVSVAHLSRLFRLEYEVGATRGLEWVRLLRAHVLLARSTMSVGDISRASGFSTPYYFSRRFKETFGVAPSAVRSARVAADLVVPAGVIRLENALLAAGRGG